MEGRKEGRKEAAKWHIIQPLTLYCCDTATSSTPSPLRKLPHYMPLLGAVQGVPPRWGMPGCCTAGRRMAAEWRRDTGPEALAENPGWAFA